jgi:hypothetical protein
MIQVKLNLKTRKLELIDDSESTPGASRILTAFQETVMPSLERIAKASSDRWLMSDLYAVPNKADGITFVGPLFVNAQTGHIIEASNPDYDEVILQFLPSIDDEKIDIQPTIDKNAVGKSIIGLLLGILTGLIIGLCL